jgi:hypothetical protein
MFHLTNILLIVGAFLLILGMVIVVRAYRENRREETAPFRHYFNPEYDRSLFPRSSWCDNESLYHRQTRVRALKVRDPNVTERSSKNSGASRQD